MKPYVCFDPATGEITQSGWCNSEEDMLATVGDRPHVASLGDRSTHYVDGGTIQAYTPEQRAAKARLQVAPCRWNNATMAYEPVALG